MLPFYLAWPRVYKIIPVVHSSLKINLIFYFWTLNKFLTKKEKISLVNHTRVVYITCIIEKIIITQQEPIEGHKSVDIAWKSK